MQQPPWVRKAKEELKLQLRKITHKRLNIKNNHPGGISEVLPDRKKKEDSMFYIFSSNRPGERKSYERSSGAAPSTYDPAGIFQPNNSLETKIEHFLIIIEDEREISIKQQQRCIIGRANFRKKA